MPALYTQLHEMLMDPDRIPYAMAAILLVMLAGIVTGPRAGNANPLFFAFYDILLGRLGERMDRPGRMYGDLAFRGFVLTVFALILAYLLGRIVGRLTPVSVAIEVAGLSLCLTAGTVWYSLLRLYFALGGKGQVKGAFYAIARSARTDLNATDDGGIMRAAIGFAATVFDKGMVAPVLWYLIGGLPLAFLYTALAALAWRFGKNGQTTGFGAVPLALDKLMGFVPSLMAGVLFCAASVMTPAASIFQSVRAWWPAKDKALYAQGGMMLAAAAWPLGIILGGPVRDISGATLKNAWVGPDGASAKVEPYHLKRAIYMDFVAHFLFLAALGGAYLFSLA